MMNDYRTKFRSNQGQAPEAENPSTQCAAHGCSCRATVKISGGWTCFAHAHAEPEDWGQITMMLREHSWLGEFIDEIKRMDQKSQDWRGFAMQFWENTDTFCQPDPRENAVPYENRMRSELLFRIGQISKRPQPRIPVHMAAKPGVFAGMRMPKPVVA